MIIALMALKRVAPDSFLGALIPEHLGLSLLCLIPVYVYAAVLRIHLVRDLARGVKIVREAVLENKKKIDSDDSTSFRIFVTVSGSSPPLTFQVPEEVHDSLVKGQAIRISYAPRSMVVLELQSNGYHYLPVE
ncbi:hypothetical protein J5226_10075 [Lysobacter sp. K5869]|uniref:hypothetical protein n=1 Tax=Lysobacter sp. K5869 TaxID=2820808 RepID=UPI001C062CAD|nr:hypothetical protein [Lysobacter sp. K5869]QWP78710.1 hypothetical protein J5226_10075 [Lysobacter sp. K5869]